MSKKYSVELKMQAVKMYLDEGISSTRIAKELKLSTHHRVMLWVNRYKEFGVSGLEERRGKTKGLNKGRKVKNGLSVEEEIIRLKAENEYLKNLLQIERW